MEYLTWDEWAEEFMPDAIFAPENFFPETLESEDFVLDNASRNLDFCKDSERELPQILLLGFNASLAELLSKGKRADILRKKYGEEK